MLEIFNFFNVLKYSPFNIVMSTHAFMLGVLSAFKSQISVYTIQSFVPHHPQSLSGNQSFFIPPSVGSFSSAGKSF